VEEGVEREIAEEAGGTEGEDEREETDTMEAGRGAVTSGGEEEDDEEDWESDDGE
jgi:hypothetical protein